MKRLSLGILAGLMLLAVPFSALAASMGISPQNTSVSAGSTFTVHVTVSSNDQAMNAVSGTLTFPPGTLQVVNVTKGSTVTLWVQDPAYSNSDGTISFSGVVPNPGYQGSGGTVISVTFRAIQSGTASLRFSQASVLANDGQGSEIITGASGGTVTVGTAELEPTPNPTSARTPTASPQPDTKSLTTAFISSPTHPDQRAWYNERLAMVTWTNPPNVTQLRTSYDRDHSGKPTILRSSPVTERSFVLDEGLTYFHLQVKDDVGWGPVMSYQFQLDTAPPAAPIVGFADKAGTATIIFSSADTLSGISHYEVRVGEGEPVRVERDVATFNAKHLAKGGNTIIVTAVDNAGNRAVSPTPVLILVGGEDPAWYLLIWKFLTYCSAILILLVLIALMAYLGFFFWNRFRPFRLRTVVRFQTMKDALAQKFWTLRKRLRKR